MAAGIVTHPGYSVNSERRCCNCGRPTQFCDGYVKAGDLLDVWEGKRTTIRELCGSIASKKIEGGGCAHNFEWQDDGTLRPLTKEEKRELTRWQLRFAVGGEPAPEKEGKSE